MSIFYKKLNKKHQHSIIQHINQLKSFKRLVFILNQYFIKKVINNIIHKRNLYLHLQ